MASDSMSTDTKLPIVLLSKDLFFIAKVKETAVALSLEVTAVKSEERLLAAVQASSAAGLLLIDLEKSGCELERLAQIYSELAGKGWKCLSFFSHVHDELCEKAEQLGLGEVMPRSRFVKVLPEVLARL
jgi:hypothetical protein